MSTCYCVKAKFTRNHEEIVNKILYYEDLSVINSNNLYYFKGKVPNIEL